MVYGSNRDMAIAVWWRMAVVAGGSAPVIRCMRAERRQGEALLLVDSLRKQEASRRCAAGQVGMRVDFSDGRSRFGNAAAYC